MSVQIVTVDRQHVQAIVQELEKLLLGLGRLEQLGAIPLGTMPDGGFHPALVEAVTGIRRRISPTATADPKLIELLTIEELAKLKNILHGQREIIANRLTQMGFCLNRGTAWIDEADVLDDFGKRCLPPLADVRSILANSSLERLAQTHPPELAAISPVEGLKVAHRFLAETLKSVPDPGAIVVQAKTPEISPEERTRPMSITEAAGHLRIAGHRPDLKLKNAMDSGDMPFETFGSLYVFCRSKFPVESQESILS